MSLFEDDHYQWRETFFVFFDERSRPSPSQFQKFLAELGSNYEVREVRTDDDGRFESATVLAPGDFAAMDITYVGGDEVTEQIEQMSEDLGNATLNAGQVEKLRKITRCNARFDIYHFEQMAEEEDEADMMDPGGLLIVLERLAKLCDGVGLDPQSGQLM
ncbi:MAG: hypothetical protein KY475_05770 [Planctomycetes bacterium]|nr:hypothetical protein [Planctomycetota bacterium]